MYMFIFADSKLFEDNSSWTGDSKEMELETSSYGPVVKSSCSQCRGHGFIKELRSYMPHIVWPKVFKIKKVFINKEKFLSNTDDTV